MGTDDTAAAGVGMIAWRSMRRVAVYPRRQKGRLSAVLAVTLATAAVTAAKPWPLKVLVDYALLGEAVPAWLAGWSPAALVVAAGGLMLAIYLAATAFDVALTWLWAGAGERMVQDLAADLFDRLQRLSLRFHASRSAGDAMSRLTGDTYCVYKITDALLIAPAQHMLTIASIGVVAWLLSPVLTLVVFATVPILTGTALYFGPRLKRKQRVVQESRAAVMSVVHQTLSATPVVQAFTAEDRQRALYRRRADEAIAAARRGTAVSEAYKALNGLTTTLGVAVVLAAGGWRVLEGTMTIGSLLVFLPYTKSLQGAFTALLKTYGNVRSAEASLDRVLEVLDHEERVTDAPDAQPWHRDRDTGPPAVNFEQVSFGYTEGQPVLSDIDLAVAPGESIGLIGPTGAGKTTLASLVPRFFDVGEGRVAVDGHDVRDLRLADLRAQVAVVLQQPFLMPMSIAENIAYGRPDASDDEIVAASQAANARGFIERLPAGYATVLGERGVSLSGGERQRIAIARALLNDAAIVILDEPTSALDTETELAVVAAIERLTRKRTTFIIAHRLSTARMADRIAVLDRGRIVELGTHDELLERRGLYRRFWDLDTGDAQVGEESV